MPTLSILFTAMFSTLPQMFIFHHCLIVFHIVIPYDAGSISLKFLFVSSLSAQCPTIIQFRSNALSCAQYFKTYPDKVSYLLCRPTTFGKNFYFKDFSYYVMMIKLNSCLHILMWILGRQSLIHLFIPSVKHRSLQLKICFSGIGK